MESGSCSIYRELLRLHFGDEGNFCEGGILAEVLDCYFIFQEAFFLLILIWQPAKDRSSIQIFDPDPSHSPGAKDQRPWGWSRLWAGYYWLASPQVGRNRNRSFENILLLNSSNFLFSKVLGLPAAQRVGEE